MGVLENYVILETGIPTRLHFVDHTIQRRTITDPLTGTPASRNVLVFDVDEMDRKPVSAKYSIMAEKHAAQFGPFLPTKSYRDFTYTITRSGEGFRTSWSVLQEPR